MDVRRYGPVPIQVLGKCFGWNERDLEKTIKLVLYTATRRAFSGQMDQ